MENLLGVSLVLPTIVNVLPVAIVTFPFNVVKPVTFKFPPRVVAPVPTVNVLLSATVTFPFNVDKPPTTRLPTIFILSD